MYFKYCVNNFSWWLFNAVINRRVAARILHNSDSHIIFFFIVHSTYRRLHCVLLLVFFFSSFDFEICVSVQEKKKLCCACVCGGAFILAHTKLNQTKKILSEVRTKSKRKKAKKIKVLQNWKQYGRLLNWLLLLVCLCYGVYTECIANCLGV